MDLLERYLLRNPNKRLKRLANVTGPYNLFLLFLIINNERKFVVWCTKHSSSNHIKNSSSRTHTHTLHTRTRIHTHTHAHNLSFISTLNVRWYCFFCFNLRKKKDGEHLLEFFYAQVFFFCFCFSGVV
jgi:hypothetical protein